MKLLLDTHLLLWAAGMPQRLPDEAHALIEQQDTELIVSAASLWEVAIKNGLGRQDIAVGTLVAQRPPHRSGQAR